MTATPSINLAPSMSTARPASGSLWRAPLVMMFIILATLVLGPVQSAHASADEAQFLALVNVERVSRGLPILTLQPVISDNLSRPWSMQMAASGRLAHSGSGQQILDSVARYYPTTTSAGENVGYAASVVELHAALMASAPHRANILSGTFRSVGLGVVQANGQVWVTQTFFAVSNKAAPAPAQPAPAKPAVAAPAAPKPPAAAAKPAAVRPAAAAAKPAAVRPAAAPKPAAVKPATVLVAPAAAPPPAVSGQAANAPSPAPAPVQTAVDEVADLAAPFLVDSGTRVTPAGAVASALALCLALAVRRQLRYARD
ncbi:MAG: CAP domain-containing protein [Actinobacteria bacterium]|nr:CAP domain-containing protein [Actinomycetota bacterium]